MQPSGAGCGCCCCRLRGHKHVDCNSVAEQQRAAAQVRPTPFPPYFFATIQTRAFHSLFLQQFAACTRAPGGRPAARHTSFKTASACWGCSMTTCCARTRRRRLVRQGTCIASDTQPPYCYNFSLTHASRPLLRRRLLSRARARTLPHRTNVRRCTRSTVRPHAPASRHFFQ